MTVVWKFVLPKMGDMWKLINNIKSLDNITIKYINVFYQIKSSGRFEIIELLNFLNIFCGSIERVLNAAFKNEGFVTYATFLQKKNCESKLFLVEVNFYN